MIILLLFLQKQSLESFLHSRDTTFDKEVTKESSDGSVRGAREVLGAQEVLVLAARGWGAALNDRLVMTAIMATRRSLRAHVC